MDWSRSFPGAATGPGVEIVTRPLSFRFRILALVVGIAIVPLLLIGLFLVRSAEKSGERLLSDRLSTAADETRDALVRHWIPLRSGLLDVAQSDEASSVLAGGPAESLRAVLLELDPRIREVEIRSAQDSVVFRFDRSALSPQQGGIPPPTTPLLRIGYDMGEQDTAGSAVIVFALEAELLLPRDALPASSAGMVVTLLDPQTATPLIPVPIEVSVLSPDRFDWGGEEWRVAHRSFRDPPLELVTAAPLTPYVAPFRRSARNGAFLLSAVALGVIVAAGFLTLRMTRSLGALVQGADAVAAGELSHRIDHPGGDEIGRVASAFNSMTESLQRTLREQAGRESLAAMGEFAASLAHEIRNPLTAVKIDLQSLEERLGDDPELKDPLRRALEEIERLDSTVGDALTVVRRSDGDHVLDVRGPLEAAVHSSRPAFDDRGSRLDLISGDQSLLVLGDYSALQQLFLNVLLNAAEALPAGGVAEIRAANAGADEVLVTVQDDGPGIPDEVRDRIFEPLFSTKESGTGLGLTISRRIVDAHRGEMTITGGTGGGTRVEITIPGAVDASDRSTSDV